jgi:DNA polymerase I-like protein with 3'-5' exonuclease and polymerase domains
VQVVGAAAIRAFAERTSAGSPRALGVALDPRGLSLAVAGEDGAVHLLVPDTPGALAPLRTLWGGSGPPRPPYVVFADALAALRVLAADGLSPARIGCVTVAETLLAEGVAARGGARTLAAAVELRLGRRLREPEPGRDPVEEASVLVPLMQLYAPLLRERGCNRAYELETRVLDAIVAMEAAGMRVDGAAFERVARAWEAERVSTSDPHRQVRLDKLLGTYRWWGRDYIDPKDGRIHPRFHPLAADSGRLSCTDPNLQQVPTEHTAPGLRSCFVPEPGAVFVIADYAQIELRVAAHLAPCDALRRVFAEGRDPHRATAATITGKAEAEITPHERKLAKAVNFGFLFGMGARRFREYARDGYGVELDEREAAAARDAFFATFPGIAAWHRRVRDLSARADHEAVVVTTALGRRKRFPAGQFGYAAALNIPVQGTAAEGFKAAMIDLHPALSRLGGRGVLCVHDEYIAEVPAAAAEPARRLVVELMESRMHDLVGSVPIEVSARITDAWV